MKQRFKSYIGLAATVVAVASLGAPAGAQLLGSAQSGTVTRSSVQGGVIGRSSVSSSQYVLRGSTGPGRIYTAPPSTTSAAPRQTYGYGVAAPVISYPQLQASYPLYPTPWTGAFAGLPNPYNPPWDLAHNQAAPPVWEGNASPVVISSGYCYPAYCGYDSGADVCPSVYGEYIGMPGYFYSPEDVVFGSSEPTVFDPYSGQTYDYGYDTSDSSGGYDYSDANAVLPDETASFNAIAQSWAHHNMGGLSRFVSNSNAISVGQNGQYKYSVSPRAYQLMTRDAMAQINTTDFHYTAVRVQPNGEVTGYGMQHYQASTGDRSTMYVAYTLRRDASAAGGYSIAAIQTSPRPLTPARTHVAAPAPVRNARYGN